MHHPGNAPGHWTVPAQRVAPPASFPRTTPLPVTATRGGHHDWGAVVAALSVLLTVLALAALVVIAGPGASVGR